MIFLKNNWLYISSDSSGSSDSNFTIKYLFESPEPAESGRKIFMKIGPVDVENFTSKVRVGVSASYSQFRKIFFLKIFYSFPTI